MKQLAIYIQKPSPNRTWKIGYEVRSSRDGGMYLAFQFSSYQITSMSIEDSAKKCISFLLRWMF